MSRRAPVLDVCSLSLTVSLVSRDDVDEFGPNPESGEGLTGEVDGVGAGEELWDLDAAAEMALTARSKTDFVSVSPLASVSWAGWVGLVGEALSISRLVLDPARLASP